jgi:hypothetical protein
MADRSIYSKAGSTVRLLGNSVFRGTEATNQRSLGMAEPSYVNINNEENEAANEIQISESLSEVDPYDFGYFTLSNDVNQGNAILDNLRKEEEDQQFKSEFLKEVNKAIKKVNKFTLKSFNLISHINEINYTVTPEKRNVGSVKELISHFAKEENDYKHLIIPSVDEVQPTILKSKGGKSRTMSMRENANQQEDEFEVRNTDNSYLNRAQNFEIRENNNFDSAIKLNMEYKIKKEKYEMELIVAMVNKFDESVKAGSKIVLNYVEPYKELKKESVSLRADYAKTKYPDKIKLQEWKLKSINLLISFIGRIEKELDDRPTGKDNQMEGTKKIKNYVKWKKKLSELVNIWELFSSNGIDMKFPIKYLILKKYFTTRAFIRQNNLEEGRKSDDNENLILAILKSLLGAKQSATVPKSVFMPAELLNILLEIFTAILLVYNLFSIPMINFLGLTSESLLTVEKFIDVFFYIEFIINWRKVFRDKSNNYVYDINRIFWHYLGSNFYIDFFLTIPWYFFFLQNQKTFDSIKKVIMCLKILRAIKLGPVMSKIESLKGANYLRLFKLVFIFFFFAHWLGCILYYFIDQSIDYSSMVNSCYVSSQAPGKDNLTLICRYMLSLYNSSYIIPGQYTSSMTAYNSLNNTGEYLILLFEYMIGQVLSAYIFGGMAAIIQNLNQGQNFFTNKIDMLNEHMRFYEVNHDTMSDVKIYFNYMWQRHKDVIYGKSHFDLLSRSLREKFERLNLPGNEVLLAKFYNLNPGNSKLIGNILMNLSKVILFPYEILFEEGSVTKGVYILLNGDVILTNKKLSNLATDTFAIDYADAVQLEKEQKVNNISKGKHYDERYSVVFPLISALIKTGRNWQRCYSKNFTDLLFLPLNAFDQLIFNFPIEMHVLKHHIMDYVSKNKMFENEALFNLISQPSSRSVSKYYEKVFDEITIWIPIPIPISQRKIARNYIDSFVKKVRNQWREILLMGDLNFCLNSYSVVHLLRSKEKADEIGNLNKATNSMDPIDNIKSLSKMIERLSEKHLRDFTTI